MRWSAPELLGPITAQREEWVNPTTQSDIYSLAMVVIEVITAGLTHLLSIPNVVHFPLQGIHRENTVSELHQRECHNNDIKGGAATEAPWQRSRWAWTSSLEAHSGLLESESRKAARRCQRSSTVSSHR